MKEIMETVFIADDEANIREGLKFIIDWEELGFTICGEAGNGEDALRDILRLQPSLVLIDMRMPKLYGLEVIEQAKAQGYSGTFVILSGYSDFKYAQTAMKFGVKYYLTKPMDEEELEKGVVFEQVDLRREMVNVRFLEINHYNHYNHYKNHEKVMVSNGRVMVEPKK